MTHQVQVEYGNVGVDFKYVPREGFGWMNASFQIGLGLISRKMRRALSTCTDPDLFFEKAFKDTTTTPEDLARRSQRRRLAEAAAKTITCDGQTTAAITCISCGNHASGISRKRSVSSHNLPLSGPIISSS
jgi:alpha,alpha-trehalase